MKNEVVLRFIISDYEDITHEDITRCLEINPVKFYVKGERKNPKFTAIAKSNGWIMDAGLDKHTSFEEQMTAMNNIIETKIDLFRPFCMKYNCEFSCAVFISQDDDESTPSIHLDQRYNRLIRELNIEFDVDLYLLPKSDS